MNQELYNTIISNSSIEYIAPSLFLPTRLTITLPLLDKSLELLEEIYNKYDFPKESRRSKSIEILGMLHRIEKTQALFRKEENISQFLISTGFNL